MNRPTGPRLVPSGRGGAPRRLATALVLLLGPLLPLPAADRPAQDAPAPDRHAPPPGALIAGQDGVTVPQRIRSAVPRYPLGALEVAEEGQVELLVRVGKDGTVREALVVECSNPGHGFERAAREAVESWRYAPALRGGEPVEVYTTVKVNFQPVQNQADRRWERRQAGLRSFAQENLYQDAVHVAGQNGVSWPVLRKRRSPVSHSYPAAARKRHIESRVLLLIEVRRDGTVGDVLVSHAERQGHGFEEAAKKAVRRWRFTPAIKNGNPVDVWDWVEIDFSVRPRQP